MDRKKLMSKIITAAIAGGMLISTGTLVFAAASTSNSTTGANVKKHEAKMNRKNPTENIKSQLDKLVTAGTITADEETAIINGIKQEQTDRQTEMDKVKNMSEADRKAYFESKKTTEKTDFLSSLITAGTLTQTQADAVKNVIHQGHGRKDFGLSSEKMKTQLDKLVTAGTITQVEETNILNYLTEKQTERKAEMDKVKNMSEADRKAYFESKKTTEKTDLFSQLVTAGIITQDKADAIKVAMPTPKAHHAGQETKTN
jgi:polyhydroxyalkanoate synthesis regulator phasin